MFCFFVFFSFTHSLPRSETDHRLHMSCCCCLHSSAPRTLPPVAGNEKGLLCMPPRAFFFFFFLLFSVAWLTNRQRVVHDGIVGRIGQDQTLNLSAQRNHVSRLPEPISHGWFIFTCHWPGHAYGGAGTSTRYSSGFCVRFSWSKPTVTWQNKKKGLRWGVRGICITHPLQGG